MVEGSNGHVGTTSQDTHFVQLRRNVCKFIRHHQVVTSKSHAFALECSAI